MAAPTHVLFDFFGTLVAYVDSLAPQRLDRTHGHLVAAGARLDYDAFSALWEDTYAQHEQRAQQTLDEFSMTEVSRAFLRRVLPAEPDAALVAGFRDTFLDEWSQGVRYLPEVRSLLAELAARFTLVLVSNTHHAELVHGHLRKMEVERHFRHVVTSVEHGRRKPSPCIFHRALELTNGKPGAAVYVGDSFGSDYRGALEAGLQPLLIDPQHRHPVPDEHRIPDIVALRKLL